MLRSGPAWAGRPFCDGSAETYFTRIVQMLPVVSEYSYTI